MILNWTMISTASVLHTRKEGGGSGVLKKTISLAWPLSIIVFGEVSREIVNSSYIKIIAIKSVSNLTDNCLTKLKLSST